MGCTSTTIVITIPVVVTAQDGGGSPEPSLPVYAFDGATYTSCHKTTDVSGAAEH